MIYNDFKGLKLSALGMGNMRLPTLDGDDSRIDEAATEQILDYCMTHGVTCMGTISAPRIRVNSKSRPANWPLEKA